MTPVIGLLIFIVAVLVITIVSGDGKCEEAECMFKKFKIMIYTIQSW